MKRWTIKELRQRRYKRLRPPKLVSVSEWANEFRRLSPEASAKPGKFDINETPFMREIADSFGDPLVPEIRVMKSTQIAYSENLNNFFALQIHLNPGPMMMVQPTLEMTEDYSKDRISPMIRDTPALRDLIDDRSKTSGNTIRKKKFPGGYLQMVGGNSPASLASRPVRDVAIDEEDRTAFSAGKEGDPEKIVTRRQTTFEDAKLIAGGTPVIEGASKTERGFKKGDQRLYMVPCPCCGEHIDLRFSQFQTDKDDDHYAEYQCQECEEWIEERHKKEMVKDVRAGGTAYWKPSVNIESYTWDAETGVYKKENEEVRSYYIWAAYSPFPGARWKKLCDEYNDAKGNPELEQVFWNTLVGQPFKFANVELDHEELFKRREDYDMTRIPEEVTVITAGFDTQDDRFEGEVVGWGPNEESWSLDYVTIDGDPNLKSTRDKLDRYLRDSVFNRVDGVDFKIKVAFVDTGGHRTDSVYKFVRGKQFRNIYGLKGSSVPGQPIFARYSKLKKERFA